ncbi:MAG: serine/threonine protein kinase [Chloracidobacterium sp.]|nr:serine/threonine protein kinase [Chloracidobacterium sp.]
MSTGSIQAEEWEKVNALLMKVLALDPQERHAFLKKQPVSFEIRNEVESLLAFEGNAEEILQTSALEYSKDFFDDEPEEPFKMAGQEIGAYRIVSELGLGGMGAVYLAERRDGKFDQKVAVKLLKREFNAGKIRESFRREIEIQSKLVHPNVAAMLDTGTTDDGIPYIVMEYVDGLPIDKYCSENDLGLKERLKIFNKACDAVAFAHQNLIVHRDLKPSNILVTSEGNPKLLDFGISKLLGTVEDAQVATLFVAMTPEYASPEQLDGRRITTTTDIYSLGVVLFKLLTGTFPYDFKQKYGIENLREVTAEDPVPPSKARNPNQPRSIDRLRLKGDIDNIVLKAISKEPRQRYSTVEQFSADIWRFIDGEPVSARPATLSYRLSKFFKRNRLAVTAGSLILASIIAGTAVSLWQANTARAQAAIAVEAQRTAENEAENARSEQAKSEKISKFMAQVISYANPAWYAAGSKFGGKARVIDVLDDMGEKIDTEFEGQADIQAELHHKFAEVYTFIPKREGDAEWDRTFSQKRKFHSLRALELRKQFYGNRHELVAKDIFYSYYLLGNDDQERARVLADAVQMMRETNPNNLNFPYMLEAYTAYLVLPGRYEKYHEPYRNAVIPPTDENSYQIAERYLRESLPVFRLHYKEDNSAIFAAECKLAYTLAVQEKWADFEEHYEVCKQGSSVQEGVSPFLAMVDKKLAELDRQR